MSCKTRLHNLYTYQKRKPADCEKKNTIIYRISDVKVNESIWFACLPYNKSKFIYCWQTEQKNTSSFRREMYGRKYYVYTTMILTITTVAKQPICEKKKNYIDPSNLQHIRKCIFMGAHTAHTTQCHDEHYILNFLCINYSSIASRYSLWDISFISSVVATFCCHFS